MSKTRVGAVCVAVVMGLALLPALASAEHTESQDNPWPVDGADAANTRQTSVVGPANPVVRWGGNYEDYEVHGIIGGTAGGGGRMVVDNDGNLLVRVALGDSHPMSTDNNDFALVSLSAEDGSVRWESLDTATHGTDSCIPAVAPDGTIYTTIPAETHLAVTLVGLDPHTGQPTGPGIEVPRACVGSLQFTHDGTLLYTDQNTTQDPFPDLGVHHLRAFTVDGGSVTPRWQRANGDNVDDLPYRATTRPVVAEDGNAIYWIEFPSKANDHESSRSLVLHRLDPNTGEATASVAVPGHLVSSMHADPDGGVIVSTEAHRNDEPAGHLYRFTDGGDGFSVAWGHDIIANDDGDRLRSRITSTMVLSGDQLVSWYPDVDVIFSLDWRTGTYTWESRLSGTGAFSSTATLAADGAGNVYYQRFGGPHVGSVDAAGRVRGELQEPPFDGRTSYVGPFLHDGALYVARGGDAIGVALLEEGAFDEACPVDDVPGAPFTDIAGNHHEHAIECAAWHGLTQGTSETTYSPSLTVRRDQMASFIARLLTAAGVDLAAPSDQGFTDIAGNIHADAINQLAEIGVVLGTSDTTYAPAARVRRDQMASFIIRAYEHVDGPLPDGDSPFTDIAGNTHEDAIEKAFAAEFTLGATETTYAPATRVRRDQMASFLTRVLDRLAGEGYVDAPA